MYINTYIVIYYVYPDTSRNAMTSTQRDARGLEAELVAGEEVLACRHI